MFDQGKLVSQDFSQEETGIKEDLGEPAHRGEPFI